MRVVANIADASIVQAEKTPNVGDAHTINGKFVAPIPEMVSITLDSSSYILPVDGGDVMSLALAQLLVEYPMYENLVFNPLLVATDIADLDLTATFTPTGDITRAIVGRGSGPLPTGAVPNMVGVPPQNGAVVPPRPGLLISDTIDIGPLTSGAGADEFMMWWRLYEIGTTHDVTSAFGATAGQNTPALKRITEVDQEPSGFEVWLSHDDGATYIQMDRLTPTDFTVFGSLLRVAFRNTNTSQRRLVAAYAVLF